MTATIANSALRVPTPGMTEKLNEVLYEHADVHSLQHPAVGPSDTTFRRLLADDRTAEAAAAFACTAEQAEAAHGPDGRGGLTVAPGAPLELLTGSPHELCAAKGRELTDAIADGSADAIRTVLDSGNADAIRQVLGSDKLSEAAGNVSQQRVLDRLCSVDTGLASDLIDAILAGERGSIGSGVARVASRIGHADTVRERLLDMKVRRRLSHIKAVFQEEGLIEPERAQTPVQDGTPRLRAMMAMMPIEQVAGAYFSSLQKVDETVARTIEDRAPAQNVANWLTGNGRPADDARAEDMLRRADAARREAIRLAVERNHDADGGGGADDDPNLGVMLVRRPRDLTVGNEAGARHRLVRAVERRLGGDADAWGIMLSMAPDWELTFADLLFSSTSLSRKG